MTISQNHFWQSIFTRPFYMKMLSAKMRLVCSDHFCHTILHRNGFAKWSADHFCHTILHNGLSPKTIPPDQFHIVRDHLNWPGSRKTVGRLEPVDYLWRMINAFCLFCVYLSDSYPDLPQADFARLDKIRYVGSHVIIIHVQYAQYGINQHNKKSRGST